MNTENLSFTDHTIGTGVEAIKGALLLIDYDGFLKDGTKFDSTSLHGRPYQFVVGSSKVIKGLSLGVVGMREGGQRRLFIPSYLAYGDRQIGKLITPHSDLIFEIKLIEARHRE